MKNLKRLLRLAYHKMWEDAPTNAVGTGANVSLPPAVEPPGIPKRRNSFDGRTKAGRKFVNKILLQRLKREQRKMSMKEELVLEAEKAQKGPTETERAQKQIAQQKKLDRQKELQMKSQEAKRKMMSKTKEMDTLMKARLTDFRKKAAQKTQQLQKQNASFEPIGDSLHETIGTIQRGQEVLATLMRLAGDATFEAKEGFVQFQDGRSLKVNSDVAKRMVATFESLDNEKQQEFRFLMNRDVESFLKMMHFTVNSLG